MSKIQEPDVQELRRDIAAMSVTAEARFHRIEQRVLVIESELAALQAQVEVLKGAQNIKR